MARSPTLATTWSWLPVPGAALVALWAWAAVCALEQAARLAISRPRVTGRMRLSPWKARLRPGGAWPSCRVRRSPPRRASPGRSVVSRGGGDGRRDVRGRHVASARRHWNDRIAPVARVGARAFAQEEGRPAGLDHP